MAARALPHGAHTLPQISGKPRQGRPGFFKSALVLAITFTLISWGATRHTLALNLGNLAIFREPVAPWMRICFMRRGIIIPQPGTMLP